MRTNNLIISKKKSFMEYTNIEVFLLTTLKLFNNAIGLEMVVSFAPPLNSQQNFIEGMQNPRLSRCSSTKPKRWKLAYNR